MMRNSLPRFISFSSGRASSVSSGSWRIFSRMLYLDGAMMSSCSRIRPSGITERQTHRVTGESAFALRAGHHIKVLLPWCVLMVLSYGMQSRHSPLPQTAIARGVSKPRCHLSVPNPRYLPSCPSKAKWHCWCALLPRYPATAKLRSLHWAGRGA